MLTKESTAICGYLAIISICFIDSFKFFGDAVLDEFYCTLKVYYIFVYIAIYLVVAFCSKQSQHCMPL